MLILDCFKNGILIQKQNIFRLFSYIIKIYLMIKFLHQSEFSFEDYLN